MAHSGHCEPAGTQGYDFVPPQQMYPSGQQYASPIDDVQQLVPFPQHAESREPTQHCVPIRQHGVMPFGYVVHSRQRSSPHLFSQTPFVQVPSQTLPHTPQLSRSVSVSTQWAPQSVSPSGQSQLPFRQTCPFVHVLPQPPQLVFSLVVSAQRKPRPSLQHASPKVVLQH